MQIAVALFVLLTIAGGQTVNGVKPIPDPTPQFAKAYVKRIQEDAEFAAKPDHQRFSKKTSGPTRQRHFLDFYLAVAQNGVSDSGGKGCVRLPAPAIGGRSRCCVMRYASIPRGATCTM